ncbi:MAG: GAF domain-containing protein [Cyanobacteria bacterium P01_A01_bin.37]
MAPQQLSSLDSCQFNLEREKAQFRVIEKIREHLDLATIFQTTIQEIRQLLAVDRIGVLQLDPASGWDEGEFIAETVLPKFDSVLAARVRDHCFGQQYAVDYQQGRIQAVNDIYDADFSSCHVEILSQFQVRANLLVPLLKGKDLWGLLCIHQCSGPRQWEPDEIEFVSKIAVHLGIAIQHTELLLQTQQQFTELNQTLQALQATHVQLTHTEKMVSLGQLAAGMAHEINNPINFIRGNLAYVKHSVADLLQLLALYKEHCPPNIPAIESMTQELDIDFRSNDLPNALGSMISGSERIIDLVKALRNFSQLGKDGWESVDLHDGIDNTLLMLRGRLQATKHRPAIHVRKTYGHLPKVECCMGHINQVLINILTNAIDAFDSVWTDPTVELADTVPTLSICTQAIENTVLIMIEDNGPGMPDEVKAKLYDPFFTTKPIGEGTGLGMAISAQIIANHQGMLQCVSEPGQGTEFSIKLPVNHPPASKSIEY